MSSLPARSSALVGALAALVLAVVVVGSARAATLGISLTKCGTANNGFQFTINGSGFTGYTSLDVQVTTSEAGATPNPNYVVAPSAPPSPYVGAIAPLNADGSFTFDYVAGLGQELPATIGVYTIDSLGNPQALLYSTTVTAATVCADQTTLGAANSFLPTTKEQCQKSGWSQFGIFKNEGDCVSFVATAGRNKPALLP